MKYAILVFSFFLLITSCDSKFESASESLQGEWEITSFYRSITISSDVDTYEQVGNGSFTITTDVVSYEYNLDSNLQSNTFDYTFVMSKENAGFTQVDKYEIQGNENFRVRFGDQTSDAHCDATAISLEKEEAIGDTITYLFIELEKR